MKQDNTDIETRLSNLEKAKVTVVIFLSIATLCLAAFSGYTWQQIPAQALKAVESGEFEAVKIKVHDACTTAETDAKAIHAILDGLQNANSDGSGCLLLGKQQICWGTITKPEEDNSLVANKPSFPTQKCAEYHVRFPRSFAEAPTILSSLCGNADDRTGFVTHASVVTKDDFRIDVVLNNLDDFRVVGTKSVDHNSVIQSIHYIAIGRPAIEPSGITPTKP
jgi:hypothetical protein